MKDLIARNIFLCYSGRYLTPTMQTNVSVDQLGTIIEKEYIVKVSINNQKQHFDYLTLLSSTESTIVA